MVVSKTFKASGKTYLKEFKGAGSIWTSEKTKAHKFRSQKKADQMAELHGGAVE